MRLIPLSQGKFAMVDDEDFEELMQFRWFAERQSRATGGDRWYARRTVRNPERTCRGTVSMHAVVFGAPYADHADGDGLNNQRSNLRPASRSQNAANTLAKGQSGFKGVHWNKGIGRWQAQITIGKKHRHLGYFGGREDAALAYDAAARELYGAYAVINFPLSGERSALTGELVAA